MTYALPAAPLEIAPGSPMPTALVWALGTASGLDFFSLGRSRKQMFYSGPSQFLEVGTDYAKIIANDQNGRFNVHDEFDGVMSETFTRVLTFFVPTGMLVAGTIWAASGQDTGGNYTVGAMQLGFTPEGGLSVNRSNQANILDLPAGTLTVGAINTVALKRVADGSAKLSVNGGAPIAVNSSNYLFSSPEVIGSFQFRPDYLPGLQLYFYAQDTTVVSDADLQSLSNNPAQLVRTTGGATVSPPVITGNPVIVGTPKEGVASSYTQAATSGSPSPSVTQQWTLDGNNIAGATGATYTPTAGDVGKTLRVRQVATSNQGSVSATSDGVVVVAAAVVTPPPSGGHSLELTNATFGPGNLGQALLSGYGRAIDSPLPEDKTQTFYVEFFFKHGQAMASNVNRIITQVDGLSLWLDAAGQPQYSLPGGGSNSQWHTYNDNAWHHFYFLVEGSGNVGMYLDGQGLWGGPFNQTDYKPTLNDLWVGSGPNGVDPFGGSICQLNFGLGDKYSSGVNPPTAPINSLNGNLLALYEFKGNGVDTAGQPGTAANGKITGSSFFGQIAHFEGVCYNEVTSGVVTLNPADGNGQLKQVPMTIDFAAQTWTADLTQIAPGEYGSVDLLFINANGPGGTITTPGFSVIVIEGGGDLGNNVAGGALPATSVTLSGVSSATVGTAVTITVGSDNPLAAGVQKVVTLSSDKGTFNPAQVTISDTQPTTTSQFTANTAGTATLTATATGLATATKSFTANAVVVPPQPGAPAITISTALDKIMSGRNYTLAGTIDLKGDAAGTANLFADPQPSGTPLNLGAIALNQGAFGKGGQLAKGQYTLRVVAVANGQTTTASTGVFKVLGLNKVVFDLPGV
jgi:hypothetical protein